MVSSILLRYDTLWLESFNPHDCHLTHDLSFGFKGVSALSASATVIIIMGKKQNIRGGEKYITKNLCERAKTTVTETTQRLRGGYSSVKFIQTYDFRQMKVTLKEFCQIVLEKLLFWTTQTVTNQLEDKTVTVLVLLLFSAMAKPKARQWLFLCKFASNFPSRRHSRWQFFYLTLHLQRNLCHAKSCIVITLKLACSRDRCWCVTTFSIHQTNKRRQLRDPRAF